MHFMIIQIGDMHISSEADSCLARYSELIQAISDIDRNVEHILIAIVGDISQSGQPEQYVSAWTFFENVKQGIVEAWSNRGLDIQVDIVGIPGNHDLDLAGDQDFRNTMVETILAKGFENRLGRLESICVEPQANFFQFLGEIETIERLPNKNGSREVSYSYMLTVDDKQFEIVCLNSALMSKRNEVQGELFVAKDNWVVSSNHSYARLALVHHPLGWHEATAAHSLRDHLEHSVEMILTGHEHDAETRVGGPSDGWIEYYEGGAFAEHGTAKSEFSLVLLDLTTDRRTRAVFRWDGKAYSAREGQGPWNADSALWEELPIKSGLTTTRIRLTEEFAQFLRDTVIPLSAGDGRSVLLSEIFVYPDLEEISLVEERSERRIRADRVAEYVLHQQRLLVLGDPETGKSALSKVLTSAFLSKGYLAVHIAASGARRGRDAWRQWIDNQVRGQFDVPDLNQFWASPYERRVVIVDDFDLMPGNRGTAEEFIETVNSLFGRTIIISNQLSQDMSELFAGDGPSAATRQFIRTRILPFNMGRRDELVDRWLLATRQAMDLPEALAVKREQLREKLMTLTGANRIPRLPVYLLSLLRALEDPNAAGLDIGGNGAYYELIIKASLLKGRTQAEYSKSISFLGVLAKTMYRNERRSMDREEIRELVSEFNQRKGLNLEAVPFLDQMIASRVLVLHGDSYRFGYKYGYYYFVARELATEDDATLQSEVEFLSKYAYVQDYGSILLMLAHISSKSVVWSEASRAADNLFRDSKGDKLDEMVRYFNKSSQQILGHTYVEGERERRRTELIESFDEEIGDVAEFSDLGAAPVKAAIVERSVGIEEIFGCSTQMLEVMGQLLQNFPGEMDLDAKVEIGRSACSLAFRVISFMLADLKDAQPTMVGALEQWYGEVTEYRTEMAEVRNRASALYFRLVELVVADFIRFVGVRLSSRDLQAVYSQIVGTTESEVIYLVEIMARMAYSDVLPEARLEAVAKRFGTQPFAMGVFRQLVIMQMYLLQTPSALTKKVCDILGVNYVAAIGLVGLGRGSS